MVTTQNWGHIWKIKIIMKHMDTIKTSAKPGKLITWIKRLKIQPSEVTGEINTLVIYLNKIQNSVEFWEVKTLIKQLESIQYCSEYGSINILVKHLETVQNLLKNGELIILIENLETVQYLAVNWEKATSTFCLVLVLTKSLKYFQRIK